MRRAVILIVLLGLGVGLWVKRDDAAALAVRTVPAVAPYLGAGKTDATAAAARRAPAAVPVVVTTAGRRPLPVTIEAVGTVQPLASIQIKARIDSQIVSVQVQEGAKVREGDLMLRLDDRSLKAQLAQAVATVAKDQAQVEQVRRDLARAEDLLAKRINSEVQRDTAATNVKVAESQLAADQAQRQNLEAALSYTEIRAPVSGRVGSIALKAGTTVKAADTLSILTVNQIDPIFVVFAVPQTVFGDLRQALAAGPVKVEALGKSGTSNGTVTFVENTVDLATGTVLAKATMPNAEERLWPGSFVSVRVVLGIQQEAVAVPSSAIQLGQQGAYVFVVKDGQKAEVQNVKVDRTIGSESVISAGLKGGERVVIDGQLRLIAGATVQIEPPKGPEGGVATGAGQVPPVERRS